MDRALATGLLLSLAIAVSAIAQTASPPSPIVTGLDGEWDGTLHLAPDLRLAFHIQTGKSGTVVTFDSVDQGDYGVPVSSIRRDRDHVRLEVKPIDAAFDAHLTNGGQALTGLFTQHGHMIPLALNRLPPGAPSPWPRPAATAEAPPPLNWTVPTDAQIRRLLVDRIDVQHEGVGIVIGVIGPSGRRVVAYGRSDQSDPRPLNGDTEFEIGSITKVFTSLILADMVRDGEVKLDDPAAKYLPPGASAPQRDGKQITLVDLDTHTSGLPRIPTNFAPKDPSNPYADYSADRMYQFLSGYRLARDPEAKWEYSNLGVALLGQLLARRAGMDYETLVKARILGPLRMTNTSITLTAEERSRLAAGHDSSLARAANWDLAAFAPAGALRSTANDMLAFLAAELGYAKTPLRADMDLLLTVRRPTGVAGESQALGWQVRSTPGGEIVWHDGGTGGYRSLVAYNPKTRVGIVVLTNAETPMAADDIGLHILTGSPVLTLPPPPPQRHAISLPPVALDRYVGRYQFTPQEILTISRDGDHLLAQVTGQDPFEIFPESPTDFFWKFVNAQVTFQFGPDGHATRLVLHENGRDQPATQVP